MKIFTIGHGERAFDEFILVLESNGIEVLIDIRKTPYSRYQPDFNKKSLEMNLPIEYVFAGNDLGGSPQFGKDLLEYLKNRGENRSDSQNRLFSLIDSNIKDKLFSKAPEFSNNEKRRNWITTNYLEYYIPAGQKGKAIQFLHELFERCSGKQICFMCSEKNHLHCHRHHLLEKDWLREMGCFEVVHL